MEIWFYSSTKPPTSIRIVPKARVIAAIKKKKKKVNENLEFLVFSPLIQSDLKGEKKMRNKEIEY